MVAALSEEYAAAESSDYVSACMLICCGGWCLCLLQGGGAALPPHPCPSPAGAPFPQIDRADGGAGDLAAQLASQMDLGPGLGDPRAPLRT